jgi:hypothetical protein
MSAETVRVMSILADAAQVGGWLALCVGAIKLIAEIIAD